MCMFAWFLLLYAIIIHARAGGGLEAALQKLPPPVATLLAPLLKVVGGPAAPAAAGVAAGAAAVGATATATAA